MKGKPAKVDLPFSVWKKAIDSIAMHCKDSLPEITIWGGEPLLFAEFDRLVEYMFNLGFRIKVVTNGTLLEEHADAINRFVDSLYISIDGSPATHDKIRGQVGLFDEIGKNMAKIDSRVEKVAMSFFAETNYKDLVDLPFALKDMNLDTLLLQNLIFSTSSDIAVYKEWLKNCFNQKAAHVDSWRTDSFGEYVEELPETLRRIQENIDSGAYLLNVKIGPEELTPENIKEWYLADDGLPHAPRENDHCVMPFTHLHIKPHGDVHYCVDFDDFTAGNIQNEDVMDIFHNDISNKFRDETALNHNPLCKRCSWRFRN